MRFGATGENAAGSDVNTQHNPAAGTRAHIAWFGITVASFERGDGRVNAPEARREDPPQQRGRQVGGHARNTCRRIAAALEKMRMPRTTTTPVESCEHTPSWSPR